MRNFLNRQSGNALVSFFVIFLNLFLCVRLLIVLGQAINPPTFSLIETKSPFSQGRMTDPFTLVINFGPRNPAYDGDYTKYPTYFALHVDKGKTWFSVKLDSKVCE